MKCSQKSLSLPPTSEIGLGCSRLGSMMVNQTSSEILALIQGAHRLGVNVFDTANIYGQGRSEQLLGEALKGVKDVCIVTKAGQVFPLRQRLLAPLRAPAAALLKRSKGMSSSLKAVRSKGLPRDYRPEHLRKSLKASLRRLRRDRVEVFLLHSPGTEHLADGVALDGLVDLKNCGLAGLVGVSCDDLDVLETVCNDPRVDVIQVPFGVSRRSMEPGLSKAADRGALIIAREIFSFEAPAAKPSITDAIAFCAGHPGVGITLVGTTNLEHLREATDVVDSRGW